MGIIAIYSLEKQTQKNRDRSYVNNLLVNLPKIKYKKSSAVLSLFVLFIYYLCNDKLSLSVCIFLIKKYSTQLPNHVLACFSLR